VQGDNERARTLFARAEEENNQAIARTPDLAEAYFNLGKIFEARGPEFWSKAKENFKRAVKLRPKEPSPRFRVGDLQRREESSGTTSTKTGDSGNDNLKVFMRLEPPVNKKGARTVVAERLLKDPSATVVPNLIGRTQQAAEQLLAASRLASGRISRERNAAREGTVIRQSHKPGTPVAPSTKIDLVISTRASSERRTVPLESVESLVTVPQVQNLSLNDAIEALRKAGLRYSRSGRGTYVRSQFPTAGKRVQPGSMVTLTLGARST
jgi:hypothetical protein